MRVTWCTSSCPGSWNYITTIQDKRNMYSTSQKFTIPPSGQHSYRTRRSNQIPHQSELHSDTYYILISISHFIAYWTVFRLLLRSLYRSSLTNHSGWDQLTWQKMYGPLKLMEDVSECSSLSAGGGRLSHSQQPSSCSRCFCPASSGHSRAAEELLVDGERAEKWIYTLIITAVFHTSFLPWKQTLVFVLLSWVINALPCRHDAVQAHDLADAHALPLHEGPVAGRLDYKKMHQVRHINAFLDAPQMEIIQSNGAIIKPHLDLGEDFAFARRRDRVHPQNRPPVCSKHTTWNSQVAACVLLLCFTRPYISIERFAVMWILKFPLLMFL